MKRSSYYNAVPQVPDQWPIKKALTLSDIDITHPFLTLSRQQVETNIVVYMTPQDQEILRAEGQVGFNAQDDDNGDMYAMRLKWRGSYYNLIGKWGKVVRGKGLDVGQEIRLRWFNGCLHFSVPQQQIVPVPPPVRLVAAPPMVQDHWPIRKILTSSDVDTTHPFLPLPRKLVEEHILAQWTPQEREKLRKEEQVPINVRDYDTGKAVEDHILFYWTHQSREQLRNEHQVGINARDYDTGDVYVMKLKWRGSYYNLIGKWGKLIREKRLQVGREIRVRWDNGFLVFSVPEL
ncbi:uncharacterized protein LOC125203150 isoform X3 [Salvia hispanica]|uniref:uncharacterized protein LOC125203150 isoform X3 n=1 Tax=Salvia hispanica TaxID=49212 RepID=UPI0020095059|nr:uncharacterized protein LOC125203150 isoform X3 [Salvia hispanica]